MELLQGARNIDNLLLASHLLENLLTVLILVGLLLHLSFGHTALRVVLRNLVQLLLKLGLLAVKLFPSELDVVHEKGATLIVLLTLLRVAQDLVRFANEIELLRIATLVRVMGNGKLAVPKLIIKI